MRPAETRTRALDLPAATRTRRQRLLELLRGEMRSADELRAELGGTARDLERDLAHVDRTLRHRGSRVLIHPARCNVCQFQLHARRPRRFRVPTRCPVCRHERVAPPWFGVR